MYLTSAAGPRVEWCLGFVCALQALDEGMLLRLRLIGGAETCTYDEDARWRVGDRVALEYEDSPFGFRQLVALRRLPGQGPGLRRDGSAPAARPGSA